jgi:hypothetical protein
MVGQTQIVVGTEIEDFMAIDDHPGIGRRPHDPQIDKQTRLFKVGYVLANELKLVQHPLSPFL